MCGGGAEHDRTEAGTGEEPLPAPARRRRRLLTFVTAPIVLLVASACLPAQVPAHVGYSSTQSCIDGLASPILCATGEHFELDVISDDRSEGIIVLRQDFDGVSIQFRVWPGTSFRLMGHQRSDGTCRDVVVNGTLVSGTPFLLSCVWGPLTSPPDTQVLVTFPRPT